MRMASKMEPVDVGDHVADDSSTHSESGGPVSSVGSECGSTFRQELVPVLVATGPDQVRS